MWTAAALAAALTAFSLAMAPRGVPDDLVEVYDGFYTGRVMPTPKQAQYYDEFIPLADADGRPLAVVVVAPDAPRQVNLAAAELSAQVGLRLGRRELFFALPVASELPHDRSAVVIGRAASGLVNAALDAAGLSGPGQLPPEGYFVRSVRRGGRWIVVVGGADAIGAYWGAQSLLQLITARGGQVVMRRADITDWPDFRIRAHQYDGGFPAPDTARYSLKWCAKLKLNQLGFGQAYDRPMQWRQLTAEQKRSTEYLCRRAAAVGTVRACFYPHPHRSQQRFNIRISDPADIQALVNICSFALERGAGGIMLRSDDIWPLAEEDRRRFGDHAAAHIYLVNELYRRLRQRWPRMVFMFCPPHYTNGTIRTRHGGVDYIRRLGRSIPEDVLVVWTGPVTRSLEIKPQDVDFIVGLLGRGPLLWDNTVYAHRSRYGYDPRHPHYFLDTFATKYPADFYKRSPGITYNWAISDPIRLVAGIQTADCTWNLPAYDPEQSLRQAIAMVFGPDVVDEILALRDQYYQIFDATTSGRSLSYADEILAADAKMLKILAGLKGRLPADRYAVLETAARRMSRRADATRQTARTLQLARRSLLVDLAPDADKWRIETKGRWQVTPSGRTVEIVYPWGTPSQPGNFGMASLAVDLPPSPTGRYLLAFSCWDDYMRSGTPPNAWPGYLFKQALVDGHVVWEDDVEGREPADVEALHIIDITGLVRGRKHVTVALRGYDRRGVHNMGVRMVFGQPMIIAGPAEVASVRAEIPDAPALRPADQLTVWVDFDLRRLGGRQALFDKAPPHQYFAYVHEDGYVVAGVFVGGAERSAAGKTTLSPGRHTAALVYDGSRVRLYVDGRLDATAPAIGQVRAGRGNLHLGQYSGGAMALRGKILSAAVWLRALDERALGAVARGEIPADGLAGLWKIPDGLWTVPPAVGDGPACTVYRVMALSSP